MPGRRREHYRNGYDKRAADVRARANADPTTLCWRCQRTLDQHPNTKTGRPPRWQAGHVRSGDPTSPLLPEVDVCNTSDGATNGNRRRAGIVTTRDW